jgi:hypothetical protein
MNASATLSAPIERGAPDRSAATAIVEATLLVGTRVAIWIGIELLIAGALLLVGAASAGNALNEAGAWWMVYGAAVDLGTLAVIGLLLRRHGVSYRRLLGPPAAWWQVGLGAVAIIAATAPAIFFSAELTSAWYGDVSPPMLTVVDVPAPAAAFSVLVVPLLAELGEAVAYLGVILPRLERAFGSSWIAAPIVVVIWAAEHAFFPILVRDDGIDLMFAAYRVISVLPFLAIWTALYYAFGRRLLPVMGARWIFNTGTAVAVALGLA